MLRIIQFNKTDEKKTLKQVPSVQRYTNSLLENQCITSLSRKAQGCAVFLSGLYVT